MKIGIYGINGKMGCSVARELAKQQHLHLASASVRGGHDWAERLLGEVSDLPQHDLRVTTNITSMCTNADVVIDFTRPGATLALLPICQKLKKPLLIGTTGFNADTHKWIANAAKDIAIVLAPNTSLGVNVLFEITRRVAEVLPPEVWDVDIYEAHHREKVDAPSGTALRLGEVVAEAQDSLLAERKVYPFHGKRHRGDIGFSVVRGGDIVGEHTLFFTKDNERLELTHRATNRCIFAQGAIKAAQWLGGQPPGLYNMRDVLGFSD